MKEEKLRELLNSLSMTEKIGQLIQVPGNMLNAEGQELGVRDELGIGEELLKNVADTCNIIPCNPRKLERNEIYEILMECM